MKILNDDGKNTPPTKQEILTAIRWLAQGTRDSDSLFFYYSGPSRLLKSTMIYSRAAFKSYNPVL
jgi:hypothetical protein